MCLHQRRSCECGGHEALLFHRDSILPEEVLMALYCPECAGGVAWNAETMVKDAGWILEYDMETARFYLKKRLGWADVTPDRIFDEDYCSWYGLSPLDLEESARLHRELEPLKNTDLQEYIRQIRLRRQERVELLKTQGWRKALRA